MFRVNMSGNLDLFKLCVKCLNKLPETAGIVSLSIFGPKNKLYEWMIYSPFIY